MKFVRLFITFLSGTLITVPAWAGLRGSATIPSQAAKQSQTSTKASSPLTAFGRLIRVERSNKTSVRMISAKGARNEIKKADDGRTFLILSFTGKTKLDLGIGSEASLKKFVSSLDQTMVRTTDISWLADGSGNKYGTAYIISNPLTRTLAFDIPADITGLTWNDGKQTFNLEPSPVLVSEAAADAASTKSVPTKPDTTKPNAKNVQVLTAQDAFDALKQLNDENKLFPVSLFGSPGSVEGLAMENCFGLALAGGKRLLGESSGKNYGVELTTEDDRFVAIGSLYSDADFQVEDHVFKKGPHLVLVGTKNIRILGDGDSFTTMGAYGGSKQVPKSDSRTFPAKLPVDPALISKDSKARIKFSLTQEKGGVFISVGGNKLAIKPLAK